MDTSSRQFAPVAASGSPAQQSAMPSAPESSHARHPEPHVTLRRDNDRITQIRIECSCGQVIELDCQH